ncbi:antitoxin Xre/MbcA/ParS toxin-binding domain-containing protein [Rheinheimera sp.]|uniref:antitoxin Xre/MbcA/ParS toxin-binding domain-containing protein n=1 Tax=Rheinheimera sp. TaxID=1869214 RepID=UPI0027369260|nr:antitoxin Xre/MbcA/ParS toxin-binding domain-containing protein [Rheinheimera sp.]MDP2715703.1 DUF2384 domain-containing protein [Rheinheimera sp.]
MTKQVKNETSKAELRNYKAVQFAASNLFDGDMAATHKWLNEPAYSLGDKAPVDMLNSETETQQVLDLIGRLEHGVFS